MQQHGKRKLYIILFYAGLQPLLIWWMTSYFVPLQASLASAFDNGGADDPSMALQPQVPDEAAAAAL